MRNSKMSSAIIVFGVVVAIAAHVTVTVAGSSTMYRWFGLAGVVLLLTIGIAAHLVAYRKLSQRRKRAHELP